MNTRCEIIRAGKINIKKISYMNNNKNRVVLKGVNIPKSNEFSIILKLALEYI